MRLFPECSQRITGTLIAMTHGRITKRSSTRAGIFGLALTIMVFSGIGNSLATSSTTLSEKNLNKTFTAKLGSSVSLSLHSMYWNLTPIKSGASLKINGAPIQKPILPGANAPAGCRFPGSGCGVQTWKFSTIKVGTTYLIATRTSCGEAMRCTGSNGTFKVTVKVIK